ncbi:MAG TPA: helix-turn-helix domain-containing protein, partial [Vicinamibacterales bacterium]
HKAVGMILESYADSQLRQAHIAAALDLTAPALANLFRAHLHVTFNDYVRDVRLNQAAALLADTANSVKEVWAAVGYNDGSNFSREFKEKFGNCPTEYRAMAMHPEAVLRRSRSTAAGPPHEHATGAGRVLVVDDDVGTCDVLGGYLRHQGYAVNTAASAAEAKALFGNAAWDTMVLDYHLPDLNGLELLRRIRGRTHSARFPIVMLTADWYLDDHYEEIKALDALVIAKPCDVLELEQIIRTMCKVNLTLLDG